jgi:ABC-type phosphate transport system permease subunit
MLARTTTKEQPKDWLFGSLVALFCVPAPVLLALALGWSTLVVARAPKAAVFGFVSQELLQSAMLALLATTLAMPVALGVAASLSVEPSRLTRLLTRWIALVPAVLWFAALEHVGAEQWSRSLSPSMRLLAAGGCLALTLAPGLAVSYRRTLARLPEDLRDAASALGSTPWRTLVHLGLPYARAGLTRDTLRVLSRALGEAVLLSVFYLDGARDNALGSTALRTHGDDLPAAILGLATWGAYAAPRWAWSQFRSEGSAPKTRALTWRWSLLESPDLGLWLSRLAVVLLLGAVVILFAFLGLAQATKPNEAALGALQGNQGAWVFALAARSLGYACLGSLLGAAWAMATHIGSPFRPPWCFSCRVCRSRSCTFAPLAWDLGPRLFRLRHCAALRARIFEAPSSICRTAHDGYA